MKTRKLYFILVMFFCIAVPSVTFAQPDEPDDTAPIDGGISLLLAAGAAYGVKKYRDGKKKENEEPKL